MSNHPDDNTAQSAAAVDAPPPSPAIEILRATRDGDDLDPHHLRLLEAAVNGHLTDSGKAAFADLLANVRQPGGYVKPWYHDLQNLTQDLEGYIYWRGVQVEHYSFRDYTAADVAANQLVEACLAIEARGETVDARNVLDELSGKPATPADHPVVYRADSITDLRAALRGDV